jgi:hypothetical protein
MIELMKFLKNVSPDQKRAMLKKLIAVQPILAGATRFNEKEIHENMNRWEVLSVFEEYTKLLRADLEVEEKLKKQEDVIKKITEELDNLAVDEGFLVWCKFQFPEGASRNPWDGHRYSYYILIQMFKELLKDSNSAEVAMILQKIKSEKYALEDEVIGHDHTPYEHYILLKFKDTKPLCVFSKFRSFK